MAKTVMQMVAETGAAVPRISPAEAQEHLCGDPNTLLIDVRDAADSQAGGRIPAAAAVSAGMLPVRADTELSADWCGPRPADRSRSIIIHCMGGAPGALGANTLQDKSFTNVHHLEGGIEGWRDAGLPTESATGRRQPCC